MRIVFGEADQGFGIRQIVNRLQGDVSYCAPKGGRSLWAVRLSRQTATTNAYCVVDNAAPAAARTARRTERGLRFCWQGVDLPGEAGALDVVAEVELTASGTSEWRFSLRNRSRVWTQHTVDYPILPRVMPSGTGDALLPWKNLGGRLFRKFRPERLPPPHRAYNSPGTYMPLCAFMRDGAGLYVAAHDGEQRIKRLCLDPETDVWFATVLENAGVPAAAAEGPRYPVVIAAFRGDWWEAAHRYRAWATKQYWCRKGMMASRGDFPKNVAEVDIWVNTGGGYESLTNQLGLFRRRWPGMTIGVGWASWYATQPGNRLNPEFFPIRDTRFPDVTKHPLAKNVHFMPYLNGRIWDISAAGFAYARTEATADEDGRLYEEHYGETFAVMCPACPVWQAIQRNLGRRCLDTFGCDMAYYDQVSCSRPKPCFNPAHGHPLGGGTWWTAGYRKMFAAIHDDFQKRGAAVTSEQLGEAWLDVIDAYLNASAMLADDVPLFPAVYQGYCVHFGRAVGCDKPHQTRAWRFLQDAKTILWGEAPGWIGPHIYLFEKYADEAANILQAARFRREHADFLIYGTLEGEVRFEKNDPAVYGTVWRDARGLRTALAFVNATAQEKTVRCALPGGRTQSVTLPPMRMTWLEP